MEGGRGCGGWCLHGLNFIKVRNCFISTFEAFKKIFFPLKVFAIGAVNQNQNNFFTFQDVLYHLPVFWPPNVPGPEPTYTYLSLFANQFRVFESGKDPTLFSVKDLLTKV